MVSHTLHCHLIFEDESPLFIIKSISIGQDKGVHVEDRLRYLKSIVYFNVRWNKIVLVKHIFKFSYIVAN